MNYQLLLHNTFLDNDMFSVEMEHDKSLIATKSKAYQVFKDLIDQYVELDQIMTDLVKQSGATVTKLVSPDGMEQVVQIQCTQEQSKVFLQDPRLVSFNEMRNRVASELLLCVTRDYPMLTAEPTQTFKSFEEAMRYINS